MREQLRRERDRDIEAVIGRLEEDNVASLRESEKMVRGPYV
jgi:hypothetical protein